MMGQFYLRGLSSSPLSSFAVLIALLCLFLSAPVFAWTHTARAGETLEHLSLRYYGTPDKSFVIRAANGFVHPDNGRLTEGEPVEIPEVIYTQAGESDTWQTLADEYLASPARAPFLAELNGFSEDRMPPSGAIIQIPFHLRHIFAADESVESIARLYYRGEFSVDWLVKYNSPTKKKYGRGEVIIVPLTKLAFTEEERSRIDAFRAERYTRLDLKHQAAARETLAALKENFENGRYVSMVAQASRLLGCNRLTVPQKIGLHNYLAYAYVALEEPDMATESFKQALKLQPDMELLEITAGPKILKAFKRARREMEKEGASPR